MLALLRNQRWSHATPSLLPLLGALPHSDHTQPPKAWHAPLSESHYRSNNMRQPGGLIICMCLFTQMHLCMQLLYVRSGGPDSYEGLVFNYMMEYWWGETDGAVNLLHAPKVNAMVNSASIMRLPEENFGDSTLWRTEVVWLEKLTETPGYCTWTLLYLMCP